MSHLNLSRLIIDNQEPGISQIGGVWLPLNQLLYLPLIWNDWSWHSGFAGSIISMIAYLVSVTAIFQIIRLLSTSSFLAFLGALLFGLNLNVLYLQSTPLTEMLYLALFLLSVLYCIKWVIDEKVSYLLLAGLCGFLQVLTRYDGWFVVAMQGAIILLHQIFIKRRSFRESISKSIVFGYPIIVAASFWLLWNFLIFKDPLFFINGPYSAKAQQEYIQAKAGLITHGSWWMSLLAYYFALIANTGAYLFVLGLMGLGIFLSTRQNTLKFTDKIIVVLLLVAPVIFNIVSLYLGISILNLPALHWNPSSTIAGEWFNVRYGIFGVPLVAIFVPFVLQKLHRTWLIVPVFLLVISMQTITTYREGIVTITDGVIGSSSFPNKDLAHALKLRVKGNERVLMSTSSFNAVAFQSDIQLRQLIHEGVSKEWAYSLSMPEAYAKWIVMATGDTGDPVYTALVNNQKNHFLANYKKVYEGKNGAIYELKPQNELFVTRNDQGELKLGGQQFIIRGVNSYDLAYASSSDIDKTFSYLKSIGINTVRFWAFGDGISNGFQPKAGITNEERLKTLDLILIKAHEYNMRVIPVLTNNWTDYGGKEQYMKWIGVQDPTKDEVFYTKSEEKDLFKNYVSKIVTRKNSITNSPYPESSAILAWDIMNEPRVNGNSVEIVKNWTNEMSHYVKQLDPNHLVYIGTEQIASSTAPEKTYPLCSLPEVDLCSVHLYLYHENTALFAKKEEVTTFLKEQKELSKTYNKPILLSEFGISKQTQPFAEQPLLVMKDIVRETQNSYQGYLLWNWSQTSDDSYGFSPAGDKQNHYNLTDLKAVMGE
ncbi:cellulase family glycosylhydrolase [Candidatus Roizmanbacteria bacterium]|nr:cellulase family glycosylhydrolase [Candidatus Roizmanbacteria bacterium]